MTPGAHSLSATMPLLVPVDSRLFPRNPDSSRLTVACAPADYSASRIARAVEDCDVHLLNLNVTDESTSDGRMLIELRVNRRDPSGVARSLRRYGYDVLLSSGPDGVAPDSSEAQIDSEALRGIDRVNELMRYLDI